MFKRIIQPIAVIAVGLLILSAFAGTAVAAHDPKDPDHDNLFPDSNFDDHFPETLPPSAGYDEHFPDSTFDEHFPSDIFEENVPKAGLIGFGSF